MVQGGETMSRVGFLGGWGGVLFAWVGCGPPPRFPGIRLTKEGGAKDFVWGFTLSYARCVDGRCGPPPLGSIFRWGFGGGCASGIARPHSTTAPLRTPNESPEGGGAALSNGGIFPRVESAWGRGRSPDPAPAPRPVMLLFALAIHLFVHRLIRCSSGRNYAS